MRVIETSGSYLNRGRQHGQAFARQVRALYERFCEGINPGDPMVKSRLDQIERNMQAACPEILEELQGMAMGSGMAYEDILLLNASTEFGAVDHLAHCSNFVLAGAPHGMLHGMNHDVNPANAVPFVVGELVYLETGITLKRIVWTGTVWTAAAVNSLGLSFGESTVWVEDENWDAGLPINILIALPVLRCATVPEAVALVQELAPIKHGYNFVFTDRQGQAAIVERSPTRSAVRYLENRGLYCANTFHSPVMQEVMADVPDTRQNSQDRWQNFERFAADPGWLWDMDGLQQVLRDHTRPGGACQHGRPDQAGLYSAHSYIMIPDQNQLLVTDGLPCRQPYLPLRVWLDQGG